MRGNARKGSNSSGLASSYEVELRNRPLKVKTHNRKPYPKIGQALVQIQPIVDVRRSL